MSLREGHPLRIAILSEVSSPKIDGVTNRLRRTVPLLHEAGHRVKLFVPDSCDAEFLGEPVVPIRSFPFPVYPELRVTLPDLRLLAGLRRFRPDIVHAVAPINLGTFGLVAARILGIPCVASYHTDLVRYLPHFGLNVIEPLLWPLLRRIHGMVEQTLCPSEFSRRDLEEHGIATHGLWRGGVDAEHFHPRWRDELTRERFSAGRSDTSIALFAGRLSPEKNLHILLEIKAQYPDLSVVLVGDGPARQDLERRAAGRVHFTGFLEGDALARAYASADLFVQPSTTETMGFSVLEAMSSGLPIVAARAAALPEMVDDTTGKLVDPDSTDAFVEAVGAYLREPAQRKNHGAAARIAAEKRTWHESTVDLLATYRDAIRLARRR